MKKTVGPAAGLTFLVVDDQPFHRRLLVETLRNLGAGRIEQADGAARCVEQLSFFAPDVLVTDWDMLDGDGVDLVKRLRAGKTGYGLKKVPVIMVAERNTAADIETARNSGVDEFLLKPFNTGALLARVQAVIQNRREFVESVVYIGPCRRRKMLADYEGPMRRLFDDESGAEDTPDVQIKKGLARAYIERLGMVLDDEVDRNRGRDLFLSAGQLHALAIDMNDRLLISAADSLFSYVKGVGASPTLNKPVVQAHLSAMLQLVELPNSQIDLRQTVTRELAMMVQKKLGAAA